MIYRSRFASILSLSLPLFAAAGCDPSNLEPIGTGGDGGAGAASSTAGAGGDGGSTTSMTTETKCAPDCASGQVCVESSCHALAQLDTTGTATAGACNIVLDAANVYWKTGDVRRVAKSGGPSTLLDFTTTSPGGLVVDDTYLYWTSLGIQRAEKDAPGKPGTTAGSMFADEGGNPTHMAGDGAKLYFIDGPEIFEAPTTGNPDPQAPPTPFSPTWSNGIGPIAVDAASVYFWSEAGSLLVKVDKVQQSSVTLASKGNGQITDDTAIVVDGDTVYYSTAPQPAAGGIVAKVSASGGQSTTVVGAEQGANGVFTVDDESVYFMTPAAVMKVAKGGGEPVLVSAIAQPSAFPTCIAADDKYVYWVEGPRLMRYEK